jgi:hypothetical protein
MTATFQPARRGSAKPLVGLYAESGCGKTYSALLIARGFVGPSGKIAMIETESGRGEAYADAKEYPELAGSNSTGANYDVLSLRDDFSPAAYGKGVVEAAKQNYGALIIDSASLEWEGPGGVLHMAAANQEKGMKGVLVWQQPKIQHSREFMLRVLQTPIPLVILCMRAKYPMEQVMKDGKKEWARSTTLEPKQSEDILYEMFVHGWIDQQHKFHLTKSTSKTLTPVFADDHPITIETGRQLAAWASGDGTGTSKPSSAPPGSQLETLKATGTEAAGRGIGALRIWFLGLSKADQKLIDAYKDEFLKPTAEAVDQKMPADF